MRSWTPDNTTTPVKSCSHVKAENRTQRSTKTNADYYADGAL